jgi:hypothetical protein
MNLRSKYITKAKDSFKTKFNIYLFSKIIAGEIESIGLNDVRAFELGQEKELRDLYTTEYYQFEEEHPINGVMIKDIYSEFKKWMDGNKVVYKEFEADYVSSFEYIFPFEEFKNMLMIEKCCYCKITKDQIGKLGDDMKLHKKNLRGWNLEVERFDSNLEYTQDNCAMACYWCNNAKTDEFTKEEFQPIANQISEVWKARLAKL